MQLLRRKGLEHPIFEGPRTAPRFDASAIRGFKSIHLVGGPEIRLINISRRGALIESREPLSPGSCVYLQLIMEENVHFIKGQIIGHRNCSMNDQIVQLAIAFDEDFKLLPESTNLFEEEDFLE